MKIQIKKLYDSAIIPTKANGNDAWYDLYSDTFAIISHWEYKSMWIGISINSPKGYYGRICPRSWLALREWVDILAWVIDSGYTWEVNVILINHWQKPLLINQWHRIAQLIIHKFEDVEREEVTEHEDSQRWQGWFWSSGI